MRNEVKAILQKTFLVRRLEKLPFIGLLLALAGCGGSAEDPSLPNEDANFQKSDLSKVNEEVAENNNSTTLVDPYFEILKPQYIEPYWVEALVMDKSEAIITPILDRSEREFVVSFPDTLPPYDLLGLSGWSPSTEPMKIATRDVIEKLSGVLNISFIEADDPSGYNVVAISRSEQTDTSGLSYFPNPSFEIGSDVFVAEGYDQPKKMGPSLTNYDYEVIVHELGHALGLKHPFEPQGENDVVLASFDNQTRFTAMSYDDYSATFSGNFRALDWMALTKLYGVDPDYRNADDTYNFSSSEGTFIIDGGGNDVIDVSGTTIDVWIDLRPGSHSFLGNKAEYITAPRQLTISHGSEIENVVTGSGDDTVVGTDQENIISTGAGDDEIFAGEGKDFITPGAGLDKVDLSEVVPAADIIELFEYTLNTDFVTVYGFSQGQSGDQLRIFDFWDIAPTVTPVISWAEVSESTISNGLLRLVGSGLDDATDIADYLVTTSAIKDEFSGLLISAASQGTGETQTIFYADHFGNETDVSKLAVLKGSALDIDLWHVDNFDFVDIPIA